MPTIEVRFEHLDVEAEVRVGSSGLPTVLNSITNTIEEAATALRLLRGRKRKMPVLHDVSGIVKPRRYTQIHSIIRLLSFLTFLYRKQEKIVIIIRAPYTFNSAPRGTHAFPSARQRSSNRLKLLEMKLQGCDFCSLSNNLK
jgi:hypothetical protein